MSNRSVVEVDPREPKILIREGLLSILNVEMQIVLYRAGGFLVLLSFAHNLVELGVFRIRSTYVSTSICAH